MALRASCCYLQAGVLDNTAAEPPVARQVNAAVRQVKEQEADRAGCDLARSRLIYSRGVALRFYLLAAFGVLCRRPSVSRGGTPGPCPAA
jgi:hypothetical protein